MMIRKAEMDFDDLRENKGERTGGIPQCMLRMSRIPQTTKQGAKYTQPSDYYYHNDHLGTPQVMTNITGTVVWKASYNAFGNATVDSSSTITNNIRFPGQYYDTESGLHYNWNRYYDPNTGRYITADPIGLEGGINMFGYVGGNPVNKTDPEGKSAKDWIPDVILCPYAAIKCSLAISEWRQKCTEECEVTDPENPPANRSLQECAIQKCYRSMGLESCAKSIPHTPPGKEVYLRYRIHQAGFLNGLWRAYSMKKFVLFFKRPTVWLWIIGIFLICDCIGKLFAIFAPAFLFVAYGSDPLTMSNITSGFQWYVEKAAESCSTTQKDIVLSWSYVAATSLIFMIMAPFLIGRRDWARKVVLGLIIVMLLIELFLFIYGKPMSRSAIDYCLYIGTGVFLLLPAVSRIFRKETIGGESGT